MKGHVSLKVGELSIAKQVWFDLRHTDSGTVLSLCDLRVNRRYTVCVDENGNIVVREVARLTPSDPDPKPEPGQTLPQVVPPSVVDRMMQVMRVARVRPLARFKASRKDAFILRYRHTARPRNQCYPLAGYQNTNGTYVIFRVPSSTRREVLARLISDTEMIIKDEADENRLPTEQWEQFLDLPVGTNFKLNNETWTKLGLTDVAPLVAGKIFYRRHPDQQP